MKVNLKYQSESINYFHIIFLSYTNTWHGILLLIKLSFLVIEICRLTNIQTVINVETSMLIGNKLQRTILPI